MSKFAMMFNMARNTTRQDIPGYDDDATTGNYIGLSGFGNMMKNLLLRFTGAGLTDANRQANAFSEFQAQQAFDRELQASNTQYQRATADMKAAGINPILAAGAGASTPSASAPTSAQPSEGASLGDLLSLMSFGKQMRLLKSQADLTDAQTKDTEAAAEEKRANADSLRESTRGERILNNFREESERLRLDGQKIANELNATQTRKVYREMDHIEAVIGQLVEQTKTESERRALITAQKALAEANAKQIAEMLPYQQALASAQTEQARQAAALSAVQTAYQNGLIDAGYVEAVVQAAKADGAIKDVEAAKGQIWRAIHRPEDYANQTKFDNVIGKYLIAPMVNLLENINPLRGVIAVGAR